MNSCYYHKGIIKEITVREVDFKTDNYDERLVRYTLRTCTGVLQNINLNLS